MKKLQDFTISEYNQFKSLVSVEKQDTKAILKLFSVNSDEIKATEANAMIASIKSMHINPSPIKNIYEINGKKYKLMKDLTKMSASQFIDFQIYSADNNMHEILSILLLPIEKKSIFLPSKVKKYGDSYDIFELQNDIKNFMPVSEAISIIDFFLTLSVNLLKVIEEYFQNQMKKQVKSKRKEQISTMNGKEQQKT